MSAVVTQDVLTQSQTAAAKSHQSCLTHQAPIPGILQGNLTSPHSCDPGYSCLSGLHAQQGLC